MDEKGTVVLLKVILVFFLKEFTFRYYELKLCESDHIGKVWLDIVIYLLNH